MLQVKNANLKIKSMSVRSRNSCDFFSRPFITAACCCCDDPSSPPAKDQANLSPLRAAFGRNLFPSEWTVHSEVHSRLHAGGENGRVVVDWTHIC